MTDDTDIWNKLAAEFPREASIRLATLLSVLASLAEIEKNGPVVKRKEG